jgi:hypothetical protein
VSSAATKRDGWHFVGTVCCGKAVLAAVGLPGAELIASCPDHQPQVVEFTASGGRMRPLEFKTMDDREIEWTQPLKLT